MRRWARPLYQPNLPLRGDRRVTGGAEHVALSREAAQGGMVLLKNENRTLPLPGGSRIALFGKGCYDYVKGGGGSGDVFAAEIHDLPEGLKLAGAGIYGPLEEYYRTDLQKQYEAGRAPGMTEEPELPADLLEQAKTFASVAIIGISRFSGEGWDRSDVEYEQDYNPWASETSMPKLAGMIYPKGDFYLTDAERRMVDLVCANFSRVIVVLNVGGMVETGWIRDDARIGAALLAWQGGMEGGCASADLLLGLVTPSGHLTDTFADRLESYPSTDSFHEAVEYAAYYEDIYVGYRYFETIPGAAEHVVYPFGYGLSYTTFSMECVSSERTGEEIRVVVRVKNNGSCIGRCVAQLYVSAPQGKLGKPGRTLVAFAKTRSLTSGEAEELTLQFTRYQLSSYDDLGLVQKSAYVLEPGKYRFFLGENIRDAQEIDFHLDLEREEVVQQLTSHLAPVSLERRLRADGSYENLPTGEARDINACLFEKIQGGMEEAMVPEQRGRESYRLIHPYGENGHPLEEVADGKITMEDFLAQLSDDQLISLLGGQPNTGVSNTWGFGNLPEYGVPGVMTADGPAGIRIDPATGITTTAWPCATLLACTWDTELAERVGRAGGEELKENNLCIWLAPGVNIHRSPLCGRNFEYYSEDPLIAGKIGGALVRGIQSEHVAASVKHFAANNKETNRKHSDSRVSERALREIYLKVFEIIVKESDPYTIMSAYNAINGVRCSENKELLTDVLRGEWGFQGMVTTDWWNRAEHYKEILAGNDVKMANGYPERVKKAMELGAVTRQDLESSARRVLELILKMD
ncbi:MAG: glycoside hydrolase family 3 protein [Lachnospiraceae bacterium]|nr:glycoside hydrolase family 3 protein [Lachnospiraceae bacterium]